MEIQSHSFVSLFSNPIFLSGTLSIFLAQVIKALLTVLKRRKLQAKEIAFIMLWKTGGMPSSHSALVVSLSASIAFVEGFDSLFIVSFFLSLIVIRDAVGVRRSAGLQSRALNLLGKHVSERLDIPFTPVKEIHGHRWQEAIVGSLLGLVVAVLICWRFIF
ncbi:MAG: divergent PAP2 family protein [Rectinema sp.]|uniref:Acid phosphatase/vanadium-dependent haloperoxidase related protein n=1 Tax=uncultured spirochete TaxID=156406 RepID=A0A3P3XTP1_9SPIR|nr:Acid phosphatase/vanadium-dependent haloperoxidase related protein [uncultured spirochete]